MSGNGVYIEKRVLTKNVSLSWDLSRHLYTRQLEGPVLVVTERPRVLLASLRKQWVKNIGKINLQRASSIGTIRVRELKSIMNYVEGLNFSLVPPKQSVSSGVFILHPNDLDWLETKFSTAYAVAYTRDVSKLENRVIHHGLIVLYEI